MAEKSKEAGMVGPFWIVEEEGHAAIIALAVPLDRADAYGDMLTVDTGHLEHWSRLARRSAVALRKAGIPIAPVWSEYEEWPRGRVLYDRIAQRFIVRADQQLHRPEFLRLIVDRFRVALAGAAILPDDHYHSVRRIPAPHQR
jgi:hypothetical protein